MLFRSPDLASSHNWEICEGTLSVATQDIPNGELGFAVRFGKARGGNTSVFGAAGSQLWLSPDGDGSMTSIRPTFPDYSISMGGSLNSAAAPNGEVFITITKSIEDTFNDAWDGAIRETFDFRTSSNGTVVTGTLENGYDDTRDLTLLFSDGFYTFDTTPAATIVLTNGSSTVPQANYVFIDKATKTLQLNTGGWPVDEHAKVAHVMLFDAASTQSYGAIRNQNINDHIKKEEDNGHILHMAERIRSLNSDWDSGAEVRDRKSVV